MTKARSSISSPADHASLAKTARQGRRWRVLERLLRPTRVATAFVAVTALLAHVVSLRAGYVLDDFALLVRNPWVQDPAGWKGLVTHELFEASGEVRYVPYYRPLSGLLYWASFHVLGLDPAAQHALNLALHVVVATLVFAFLEGGLRRPRIAAFMAAVFAAHPATVELVAYVGGRQDLSGWIVTLAGLLVASRLRGREAKTRWVVLTVFVTVLVASWFREFFLTIGAAFLVAPAIASLEGSASRPLGERARTLAVAGAPPAAAWALAVLSNLALRRALHVGSMWSIEKDDPDAIGVFSGTLVRLVHDALLPTDLAIDVTIDHAFAGAALVVAAAAGLFVVLHRRSKARGERELLFCGVLFPALIAVSHVPVVQTSGTFSDRYAYGFVLGVVLVGAVAISVVTDALADSLDRLQKGWAAAFLVPLALCPLTWSRAADFEDEETLIIAMVRERPEDPESAFAEGMRLVGKREYLKAGPFCARWRARHPKSDRANLCIACWHLAKGEPREAADLAAPFLESRPGHELAREVLFVALVQSRQLERAKSTIDDLLRQFPGDEQLLDQRERLAAAEAAR